MKIRTFLAIDIPDNVKDKIFDLIKSFEESKFFNWEKRNKIHLTLKFLGNIEEKLIGQIIDKLNFLNKLETQNLELKNFGLFYHKKEPKIFWAGLNVSDKLVKAVKKIEDSLTEFGIEKEKRTFKPHLTLLRIKNNTKTNFLSKLKDLNFEPIVFQTDKIIFYKSELFPTGSVYKSLHKFQLKEWSKNDN